MAEWVTTFAGWSSRLASTYGNGDQSISTGTFGGFQRYHRLYSREDLSRRLHRTLAMTMGLDVILSYDWASYDIPLPREGRRLGATMPEQTGIVRSLYNAAPAAYVEAEWTPHPSLRLVPGLRFDYYRVFDTNKWSLDPRLAVRWAVTPRLAFKASVGLFHELPNPQFLDPQLGNPNLKLPWADQYQLGIERRFTDADDLTATLFYVRRHDLPVPSVDHFSSTGQGRSYGLELLLRHQVTKHFYGWLAYTLSRTEVTGRLADDIPMGGMGMPRNGSDLSWRPGQFDQLHNLVLVAQLPLERALGDRRHLSPHHRHAAHARHRRVLRRRLQRLHAHQWPPRLGPQPDLQPAGSPDRANAGRSTTGCWACTSTC